MNILLQIEAKAVKNASSVLSFSGHSELENGLLQKETLLLREILVVNINEDTLQALAFSLSKFECSKLSSIHTFSEQRGEISI